MHTIKKTNLDSLFTADRECRKFTEVALDIL